MAGCRNTLDYNFLHHFVVRCTTVFPVRIYSLFVLKKYTIFWRSAFIIFLVLNAVRPAAAQSSVLATGNWHKLAVDKNGVYRIDRNLLNSMGFNVSQIDPRRIKIYSQGAGMLPQKNSDPRPIDLLECAVYVQGEADGVFHSQDFILFYGEEYNNVNFNESQQIFNYEKNLYAKENYYYITVSDQLEKESQRLIT